MNNDRLVSIIVPIYNTEKYLSECVDSLISQTYKNIEIILVNDGSPDDSLELCKAYANKDSRIKVVDKENGGLTSARKAGFDVCSGQLVSFIDSDDYVTENFVERHLQNFDETGCDMSISSYYIKYDDSQKKMCYYKNCYSDFESLKKNFVFPQIYFLETDEHSYPNFIWLRMYKKELITDECFVSEREYYLEDIFFNFEYLKNCKIVSIVDTPLYYYRQVATSLTNVYRKNKVYMENNFVQKLEEFAQYYKLDNPMRLIGAKYNSFRRCIENAFRLGDYKEFKNETEGIWKENRNKFSKIDTSKWRRSNKIFLGLYKKNMMYGLYLFLKIKKLRRGIIKK